MDTQNLESVLSQMTENKLSEEDQLKIKEILGKYNINKTTQVTDEVEEGFEVPTDEWQDPSDLDFLEEHQEPVLEVQDTTENIITKENQKVMVDENGQFQLPLEEIQQMELDLSIVEPVVETKIEAVTNEVNTPVEETPEIDLNTTGKKEPIFSLEDIDTVNAHSIALDPSEIVEKPKKHTAFENMAQNTLGKLNNFFNFRDQNGKIDWHGKAQKSVIVLKNIKNAALDNRVINRLKGFVSKKYNNSKFGITTNQIADTITVNLMSREDRYNRDFKNTIALLGYDVKELITPTNTPMLTLQEVSDNVNKNLKENLGLDLTNNGYQSSFIKSLNDEQKIKFIQSVVWPKLTEMLSESIKLVEALKEMKAKNPICKEIAQIAKKNDMEEDLFATMLLKSPEILKQKGIIGLDKLLDKKVEIENVYFKNEELFAKNFIVMQNLVKASSSIQKNVVELNISQDYKQKIISEMQNTVVKSDNKKKILFKTMQDSIASSLQEQDYVKSLREVNDSILKIRRTQDQEKQPKPKV